MNEEFTHHLPYDFVAQHLSINVLLGERRSSTSYYASWELLRQGNRLMIWKIMANQTRGEMRLTVSTNY